jgi:chorismate-pyruvate lyase
MTRVPPTPAESAVPLNVPSAGLCPKGPDLRTLWGLFYPAGQVPEHTFVRADQVPEPYHTLLVHEHHMTVTVEAHHGSLVDVKVLARRLDGEFYSRKILLTLQSNGRVVQFGLPRVNLALCSPEVRAEILAQKTPLGRILINHNVLRRIEPTAFFRIIPNAEMCRWFGLDKPLPTYGRLGLIHCDGKPAIEVVEILAPE